MSHSVFLAIHVLSYHYETLNYSHMSQGPTYTVGWINNIVSKDTNMRYQVHTITKEAIVKSAEICTPTTNTWSSYN